MLDSFYHKTIQILGNCVSGVKRANILPYLGDIAMTVITNCYYVNTSGLSILLRRHVALPQDI